MSVALFQISELSVLFGPAMINLTDQIKFCGYQIVSIITNLENHVRSIE